MTRKLGLVIALMLAMFVGTTAFAGTPGQDNTNMSSNNGSMAKSNSGRRRHRRARRRHHRRGRKSNMSKTTGNGNMK